MNIEDLIQIPNSTDANIATAIGFQSKPAAAMTASEASVALPAGVIVLAGEKNELIGLADYALSILPASQTETIASVSAQIATLQSL